MAVHFKTAKQDWVFSFPLGSTFKQVCDGISKQIQDRGDGLWRVTDFKLPGHDTLSPPDDQKTLQQAGIKEGDTVSVSLELVPIMKQPAEPEKPVVHTKKAPGKKKNRNLAKRRLFEQKIKEDRDWFFTNWQAELTKHRTLARTVYEHFDELAAELKLDQETRTYLSDKMKAEMNKKSGATTQ